MSREQKRIELEMAELNGRLQNSMELGTAAPGAGITR